MTDRYTHVIHRILIDTHSTSSVLSLRDLRLTVHSVSCLFYSKRWYTLLFIFFFFNDTATTEIYTLSLHDALPISTKSPAKCWPTPARRSAGVSRKPSRWSRPRW